jgi:hypothetical protein
VWFQSLTKVSSELNGEDKGSLVKGRRLDFVPCAKWGKSITLLTNDRMIDTHTKAAKQH